MKSSAFAVLLGISLLAPVASALTFDLSSKLTCDLPREDGALVRTTYSKEKFLALVLNMPPLQAKAFSLVLMDGNLTVVANCDGDPVRAFGTGVDGFNEASARKYAVVTQYLLSDWVSSDVAGIVTCSVTGKADGEFVETTKGSCKGQLFTSFGGCAFSAKIGREFKEDADFCAASH